MAISVNESVKKYEGKKPYLKTGNIIGDQIIDLEEYTFNNKPSRAKIKANSGDVIFAKMKDTHKSLKITKNEEDIIFSTGFFVLRSKDENKLLSDYLYYYLNTNEFQKIKDSLVKGATQEAINLDGLKKIKIPVPTIDKQKMVVESVKEKMDLINSLKDLKKKETDDINEILKEKQSIFPKEIEVGFKTNKGEIIKVPATKGTIYYEKKDVLKIIRYQKNEIKIRKNNNK